MKTIYILDDEKIILQHLSHWFEHNNFGVKTFQHAYDFLEAMMTEKPSLVMLDVKLEGDDGRHLCRLVKAKYKNRLPIVLMSSASALGKRYDEYEADAFIEKPFRLSAVHSTITQLTGTSAS